MLYLREADYNDVDLLFKWVNEESVRKNSINTAVIEILEHQEWFKKCLKDENVEIFVLADDNVPIGQIRLMYEDESAIIDFSIDKSQRGCGYGSVILGLAEEKVIESHREIGFLIGYVKPNNTPSMKSFERNGYNKELKNVQHEKFYMYKKELKK